MLPLRLLLLPSLLQLRPRLVRGSPLPSVATSCSCSANVCDFAAWAASCLASWAATASSRIFSVLFNSMNMPFLLSLRAKAFSLPAASLSSLAFWSVSRDWRASRRLDASCAADGAPHLHIFVGAAWSVSSCCVRSVCVSFETAAAMKPFVSSIRCSSTALASAVVTGWNASRCAARIASASMAFGCTTSTSAATASRILCSVGGIVNTSSSESGSSVPGLRPTFC